MRPVLKITLAKSSCARQRLAQDLPPLAQDLVQGAKIMTAKRLPRILGKILGKIWPPGQDPGHLAQLRNNFLLGINALPYGLRTTNKTTIKKNCISYLMKKDETREAPGSLVYFTEESVEVEGLPRDKVLQHLQQNASELVLPYLEHVISRWKDDTPLFHNTLLRQYTIQTKHLLDLYRKANWAKLRYQETQKLQKIAKEGGGEEVESKFKKTLELIDTTLLKCYTKTNNSTLLGSLVRLPDNHLNLAECEKVLKQENKYQELVDLYNSKGQHEKALRLLMEFSKGPTSSGLCGLEPTITYLQNLGKDNLSLILDYSKLVIKVEGLPRDKVLQHLQQNASELVLPYLEHVISRWKDDTPLFHNTLLRQYTIQTKHLLDLYRKANWGQDMFEERALLLSKTGHHEVALAIYVHVLNDQTMAEEYCRKNYDAEKERNKDVYLSLLKMYMSPPDLEKQYGLCLPSGSPRPAPNLRLAIQILTTYHCQIDTIKVLQDDIMPPDTPLRDLKSFLTTVLEEMTVQRRKAQALKGLLLAEHLQVQQQRMQVVSPTFHDPRNHHMCSLYPDGVIAHYYCAKVNQQEGEKIRPIMM
eukprot:Em0014g674a